MLAAWYDRQGSPADVLKVGAATEAQPGAGEVRVRLITSGVNPGDVKKRQSWLSAPMAFPRIIPHSDGFGVIDAVGEDVDRGRIGQRVWVYGAQSYRAFGTAAQSTVVPHELAVNAPPSVSAELGACLGIPGITAHRAVFADGPVSDGVVVVHGIRGAVGSLAGQLARWGGATVIGTVRTSGEVSAVGSGSADHVVAMDGDPIAAVRDIAPGGVDRVVDVAFSANVGFDAEVCRNGAVIAAYASPDGNPSFPFWPMLFANLTIRLLGSDDFPTGAKVQAAVDLNAAVEAGMLKVNVAEVVPLSDVARAHELVESGTVRGRVVVTVPEPGSAVQLCVVSAP